MFYNIFMDLQKMSIKELKLKARELGLAHRGLPREEIELAIRTVLGPASAPQAE